MENEKIDRFFLVEDDNADILLMKKVIEKTELSVELIVHKDSVTVVNALRSYFIGDHPEKPSLVILDLNLPKMSGLELLENIKKDPFINFIPIMILTTSCAPHEVKRAYSLGCNFFMNKPIDFSEFVSQMKIFHSFWKNQIRV